MEISESIVITILGIGLLLLFMLLVAVWRLGGSLLRVERLVAERLETPRPVEVGAEPGPSPRGHARDGAFLEFLSEDPDRRRLPKREQAEAYRQWRRERGLNWANP